MKRLLRWLAATHCKWLLAVTLGCLVVREEYPFSNFPMYAGFGPSTSYVFLTDANDQPLPTVEATALSTPRLKKVFSNELARARRAKQHPLSPEEKRQVAKQLLDKLQAFAAKREPGKWPDVWRIYEVSISFQDRELKKQSELLAQAP